MVYQPSHATGTLPTDGDDDDETTVRFRFHALAVTRVILFAFTLTGIILAQVTYPQLVWATILLFFCMFWNIGMLLKYIRRLSKAKINLPRFAIQCGDCSLSCGGRDDDSSEGARLLMGEPDKSVRVRRWIYRLVDLAFGVAVLITSTVSRSLNSRWNYGYGRYGNRDRAIYPVMFVVV
jgi:hypothetical protein